MDQETLKSISGETPAICPAAEAIANRVLNSVCEPSLDIDLEDDYKLHRRFDRIGRLVGDKAMARLIGSKVMVIGLGGVGSMAAEALVRSGIGHVILVDFDRVCVTNSNRQVQALKGNIGKYKAETLAQRLQKINPQAIIQTEVRFYNAESSAELLNQKPDYIIDAIDNITAKCHLISKCREQGLSLIVSTGASGRMDPTKLRTSDLANTLVDPLAHIVRKLLRQQYGFPRRGNFGIQAVYSEERPLEPVELHYDNGQGFRCVCPGGTNPLHSCEERSVIWGTAGFVTGSFGMTCASLVVRSIVDSCEPSPTTGKSSPE